MIVATAPSGNRPSIVSLKERHHEIKRRLIAGDTQREICRSLGMSDSWMSIVVSSPAFQAELAVLRKAADANASDIGQRLSDLAPDAMDVLEKAVRGKLVDIPPVKRVSFALDALDRAGHGKPAASSAATANVRVEIVQFSQATPVVPNATIVVEAHAEKQP
jgi:hypothetical protein